MDEEDNKPEQEEMILEKLLEEYREAIRKLGESQYAN